MITGEDIVQFLSNSRTQQRKSRFIAFANHLCVLGATLLIASLSAQSAAAPQKTNLDEASTPKGYVAICAYGDACAVTKPSLVAFGAEGKYAYKLLKGSFECSEKSFNRRPASVKDATCSVTKPKNAKTLLTQKNIAPVTAATLTTGFYAIVSVHSGKALEVNPAGQLKQSAYKQHSSQHFMLTARPDGYFTISPVSNYALEVKGWSTQDGAGILLAEEKDSWNQHWKISDVKPGILSITSRFNDKALDLIGLNTHNSTPVRLWTYWGGENQQWQFVPVRPKSAATLINPDAFSNNTSLNTEVTAYPSHNNNTHNNTIGSNTTGITF